ncbi:MAG: hypothetical protein ACFCVE_15605 [Phycisphaerae bacterium]
MTLNPNAEGPARAALDVHGKALQLNLDPSVYGTFAEIGGGQEVARWFLRVGAASGTVAKTICAYDKTVSDAVYGQGTRYVSRERLAAMLDHEYDLLIDRLSSDRGAGTRFFAFANTVATRSYQGDNEQHGWVGVRFQVAPGSPPSDAFIHVNLMDDSADKQQQALGLLGVNLIYACINQRISAQAFLTGLYEGLDRSRMETDVIHIAGPAFAGQKDSAWAMRALSMKMTHALVFGADGKVAEPSSVLRKRPMAVIRGRFISDQPFYETMLEASREHLRKEHAVLNREPISLLETTNAQWQDGPTPGDVEMLSRIERMLKFGPAIASDFGPTYELAAYLRRYTAEPVRMAVGVAGLLQILETSYYGELPGTVLEALGKLLSENVKLVVHAMPAERLKAVLAESRVRFGVDFPAEGNVHVKDLKLSGPIGHLLEYVCQAGWVEGLE